MIAPKGQWGISCGRNAKGKKKFKLIEESNMDPKKACCRGITALLLFALLPFSLFSEDKGQTVRLDLQKALEIALSESPTVKVADQEITKQEYAKKGVLAGLFPTLDFSANYNRTIQKQVMYMGGGMAGSSEEGEDAAPATSAGIKIGRNNTWSTGFSASMPLINAQLWKQLSISADEVELTVEKARSSRISMASQVKQAYYAVLLASDSYTVLKATYDNAMEKYTDIKQKYEQGLSSEYDLIRADVTVKNAEPSMYDAQNSIVLAKWRLKALMGVDLEMDIECEGNLSDYEDSLYADYLAVDTTMLAGNSSLRQLDLQFRQLKKSKDLAIAAYYPTLNLSFSYQWNAMSENFKFSQYRWDPYSMLGVSLTIPIFSGGKRYHSVKQSNVQLRQLELTRLDTERNLMVSLKQYTDKMKTSILQHDAASKGAAQAQKGYDIAVKRYDTGAGTLLEVNDSRLALTQAQLNLNQSIYDFLVAKASLDETLGKEN